jgi:molybdopterin synthase sulfur carrier subunit
VASLRFFAAAAEAAAVDGATIDAGTIGELRFALNARYGPEFEHVLGRCSVLVNGARVTDDALTLSATDTVDVLPPFAGG